MTTLSRADLHVSVSDPVATSMNFLDLTALGRQEAELDFTWEWLRYHDEYDN